ncbi:MAG TPA: hypothetical protein VN932_00105 [Rhizomicrobium sp.]|nr:hypothetical protein [Rhizomicrobium sp.]
MTKRSVRTDIAAALISVCGPSFGTYLWLFYAYFSSHPSRPDGGRGFVHPLDNHGAYVFISDAEATGLSLLMVLFVVGFIGALLVVPKEPVIPPPSTPRWITYVGGRYKTGLDEATPRLTAIFWISAGIYLSLIRFLGPAVVGFLVHRGIVLTQFS